MKLLFVSSDCVFILSERLIMTPGYGLGVTVNTNLSLSGQRILLCLDLISTLIIACFHSSVSAVYFALNCSVVKRISKFFTLSSLFGVNFLMQQIFKLKISLLFNWPCSDLNRDYQVIAWQL